MAHDPVNLCSAGIGALGMTAIAANQIPQRWRQYAVARLPNCVGKRIEQVALLRQSLWETAFTASVIAGIAGGLFFSYALLLEQSTRAFAFVVILIGSGLKYVLPPEQIPQNLIGETLEKTNQVLDRLSDMRASTTVLIFSSASMIAALWIFGRGARFSLDALYPPYPALPTQPSSLLVT